MRRQFSWMIGFLILACAGGQSSGGGAGAAPTERQKVQNLVPFDIGTCFPSKLDLGKTANEYTLQAAFRGARPAINECLTDAKVQAAGSATKGKVTMSIDGSGTNVTLASDGLQPAGAACIEKAIRAQLEGISAPAGGKPVTLDAPFEREPNSMVRMGVNEASDVQGAIRLALPQWCSCFEPVKTQAPPELAGSVTLTREDVAKYADKVPAKDGGTVSSKAVTAALQASDPSGTQVASCVNQRIEALPLKSANEQFIVPSQLLLLNSHGSTTMPANTPPALQFAQMDAVRELRQAEAFAALARRQNVANAYDAQVQAYQAAVNSKDSKKRKTATFMVKDLKGGCAALVKADDEYTKALESEAAVEQQALTLAQTLKAKDPAWGEAEKASAGALSDTQKQIEASKQLRTANEKACPKEKY
ncbi:MAG: hypothetical protein EHM78_08855 [Myxococcaceae bacterium]|nr:MAG: hypothetical protein EHM78_08855 [Myxococcaceae bacterium]